MRRLIFVGMHNKPHITPLCLSTKSGKLINRIINNFDYIPCIKTNLYDIDYYPTKEDKHVLALDWIDRVKPKENDIIILLGAEVHTNFIMNYDLAIIKIAHPASKRSHIEMADYVVKTIGKINKILTIK